MSRRSCPNGISASAWSGKSLPSPDLQTLTGTLPADRTCKGHSPGLRATPLKLPTAPQLPCAGVELPLCSLKALPEAAAPVFPPSEHVAGVCCLAASHRVVVARRGRRAAGCQLHPVVSLYTWDNRWSINKFPKPGLLVRTSDEASATKNKHSIQHKRYQTMRDFHAPRKKPWNGSCCLKALFRKPMSRGDTRVFAKLVWLTHHHLACRAEHCFPEPQCPELPNPAPNCPNSLAAAKDDDPRS